MKYVPQPTSDYKNIMYNNHKKARYVVQAISGAHAGGSKTLIDDVPPAPARRACDAAS